MSRCLNGGSLVLGDCLCTSHFYGTNCETPICLNGGFVSRNVCHCEEGYKGDHCELIICKAGKAVDGECDCPFTHSGAFCENTTHMWALIFGAVGVIVLIGIGTWLYCSWQIGQNDEEDYIYGPRIMRRFSSLRRSGRRTPPGGTLQSPPSYEELELAESNAPPPTYDDAISMRSLSSQVSRTSLVSKSSLVAHLSVNKIDECSESERSERSIADEVIDRLLRESDGVLSEEEIRRAKENLDNSRRSRDGHKNVKCADDAQDDAEVDTMLPGTSEVQDLGIRRSSDRSEEFPAPPEIAIQGAEMEPSDGVSEAEEARSKSKPGNPEENAGSERTIRSRDC